MTGLKENVRMGGDKVRRIRIRTLQGIEVTLLELAPERLELLG